MKDALVQIIRRVLQKDCDHMILNWSDEPCPSCEKKAREIVAAIMEFLK